MRNAFLLIALVSLALSCSDDDDTALNQLEATGILGLWEVESRGINNINSAEAFCCESLLLMEDANVYDLKGTYTYDYGTVTNGVFELDIIENSIVLLTENGTEVELSYTLEGQQLEVYYFEDDDRIWTLYSKSDSN